MKIKDMPFYHRPGFKLAKHGARNLDDAELLAIILGRGGKGESAIDLSHRLLNKYNLHRLEECSVQDLRKECNDDLVKALKILSLIELGKRYNRLKNKGYAQRINGKNIGKDVYARFSDRLKNEKQENFILLMLDNKNILLGEQIISKGIKEETVVSPQDIFKHTLKCGASRIILVHNHPSGDPTPSEADIQLTDKIIEVGDILNISVLDHVIIGNRTLWSWRSDSLISPEIST